MTIEQQHAVTTLLGGFDVAVLLLLVVGIEVHQRSVLIGLLALDERLVLFKCEVFAVDILQQRKVFGAFVEVILRQHAVVDEYLQVVPLLFVLLTVLVED